MNILVTGAGGSAGSYLVDHLLATSGQVPNIMAIYRNPIKAKKNLAGVYGRILPIEVDMDDFSALEKSLKDLSIDQVYHFASNADVLESFKAPLNVLRNNVFSTANLLEVLRVQNKKPRFLMCSTSEVYGMVSPEDLPISERQPYNPVSPYAVSKLCQDELAKVYHLAYGLPVIRTRMFTYLNPRRANLFATAFALQVAEIEAGLRQELVHGNLESIRTFVDVRDAMAAYALAMEKGMPGEVYNIAGEQTASVGEFLDRLKSLSSVPIPSREDPALRRPVDVTLQVGDSSKFKAATGWKPRYSLEESARHLLDECRRQVAERGAS